MATHSSVLAWRIPGTGEPGGLPSMGSHRVGHNWSDLAAAGECAWLQRGKANGMVRIKDILASPQRQKASVLHYRLFTPIIMAGLWSRACRRSGPGFCSPEQRKEAGLASHPTDLLAQQELNSSGLDRKFLRASAKMRGPENPRSSGVWFWASY